MTITQVLDRIRTEAGAGTSDASPDGAHLRELAAQFEAMLLGQMLREMQSSMFGDDAETGLAAGPLVEALFTELSVQLSRDGGLGIGAAMMEPLSRQAGTVAEEARSGLLTAASFAGASIGAARTSMEIPWTPSSPSALAALEGRVSSAYGWREDPIDSTQRFHAGTDIALPEGHDVPAARAGRVTFAGELPGYGLTVTVDHGDGMATRYAHLSSLGVEAGQRVGAGEVIAQSGQSGRATGPHLHFELLEEGRAVDPSRILGQVTE